MDKKQILSCAAYLTGQYSEHDVYAGVPVIIGKNGVEKIIEVELNEQEKCDFATSIKHVRALVDVAAKMAL